MIRATLPLFAFVLLAAVPAIAAETVPVGPFHSVELRGGGNVVVVPGPTERVTILEGSSRITRMYIVNNGQLRIDACNERCPQSYRLSIEIQSPRVPSLAVSGGGNITTRGGFAPESHFAAAVNGGGTIDARSVDAGAVSAAINGGGDLLVRPRLSLAAAVNGGGNIRYWGNPTVTEAVRGGGAVNRGY